MGCLSDYDSDLEYEEESTPPPEQPLYPPVAGPVNAFELVAQPQVSICK